MNSVPELYEIESQQIPTNESHINQLETISQNPIDESTNEPDKTENDISKSVKPTSIVDESPKETIVDPAILRYRKMLQFGVPRGAVELKMIHEGLDPKLL